MLKLLLLSVVLATLVLPALAARTRDPVRALRSLIVAMLLVELAYGLFLWLVFPRLA